MQNVSELQERNDDRDILILPRANHLGTYATYRQLITQNLFLATLSSTRAVHETGPERVSLNRPCVWFSENYPRPRTVRIDAVFLKHYITCMTYSRIYARQSTREEEDSRFNPHSTS
jgi:hypothetical protein